MSDAICDVLCDQEDVVARLKKELPSGELLQRLASVFSLLADETRLKIINALAVYDELCVCDISSVIDLSVSATSHQLRKLRDADVISYRREGRMIYYRLCDEFLGQMMFKMKVHLEAA
ncbi:MAG: ArsR/SmtB family transcription factor [Bradymonadaceae bacterium]